ncbi:ABC transporter permease [Aliiglaciecola sp.]|nr:ABC transporter permease [Aliiglaciecola sp.]
MYFQLLKIGLRNVLVRKANTLAAFVAFSGVIFIFAMMSSLSSGLNKITSSEVTNNIAVIVKSGVQSESLSSFNINDQRSMIDKLGNQFSINQVSFETLASVNVSQHQKDEQVPTPFRGLTPTGTQLRQATLTHGRWFVEGSDEIVVGQKAARFYQGLVIGESIKLGTRSWKVVGVFSSPSPFFNGEIWADLSSMQSAFNLGSSVQTAYFSTFHNHDFKDIQSHFDDSLSTSIEVMSSSNFLAKQMAQLKSLVDMVILGLSFIMFIGLLFGGVSIMEANFSYRQSQFQTLISLGFLKSWLVASIMSEGALLGLVCGISGVAIAHFIFSGQDISTSTQASQIVIEMHTSLSIWIVGGLIAMLIGTISAAIPSFKLSYRH